MNIENKINYWLDMAQYDLDTARAMLDRERHLYAGFMCHQVIEKSIKAYFWNSQKDEPPYTHNLLILANKSSLTEYINKAMKKLLNRLMPLNIQARYPQDKEELLRILTNQVCIDLLKQTEDLFLWIRTLLKK
jgi:HEPN domain-containing protein